MESSRNDIQYKLEWGIIRERGSVIMISHKNLMIELWRWTKYYCERIVDS